MANETNIISIRVDADIKRKSEQVMSELGLNMSTAVNMFLRQIARDHAIPITLSLDSGSALREDLLFAQAERMSGYKGRSAAEVVDEMEKIVQEVEDGQR